MERIPGYDNYFLCPRHFEVFSYRSGEYHAIKPTERKRGLVFQLCRNGIRYYLTLKEIVDLIWKPSKAAQT